MFDFFKRKIPMLEFKTIRVFGKLPGFADFVRYRSADPEAARLDAWVSSGIEALMQQGLHESLDNFWSMNLCQHIEKKIHLGTVMSSQDKSGRQYPFVLLAEVENPWLNDYQPSFPLLFKSLYDFGRRLQNNDIDTQKNLIDAIHAFEKHSFVLNKREVLENRIQALQNLTQGEAWGRFCQERPNMDHCVWKLSQISSLKHHDHIELPMGSWNDIQETTYWLQLLEDLRDIKNNPVNYYTVCSETIKKILIDFREPQLPSFQSLFRPCTVNSVMINPRKDTEFNSELSLLAGAHYWKQVAA